MATVETFNAVLGEARNGDTITLVNEEGGAVNTSGTPITINKVDVAAGATYTVAGNPTIG